MNTNTRHRDTGEHVRGRPRPLSRTQHPTLKTCTKILTLSPDHRRLKPAPIHPLPHLQRDRAPPRTPLRHRARRKLHHRLRDRRILPSPRILHPQRRPAVVPHSLETPPALRPRARIPRVRRIDARRRARLTIHTIHTARSSAVRHAAIKPFARRKLCESPRARGAQERQSRNH
jgi:hypothetical protein